MGVQALFVVEYPCRVTIALPPQSPLGICTEIVQCCILVQRDYQHADLDFDDEENLRAAPSPAYGSTSVLLPPNLPTSYTRLWQMQGLLHK